MRVSGEPGAVQRGEMNHQVLGRPVVAARSPAVVARCPACDRSEGGLLPLGHANAGADTAAGGAVVKASAGDGGSGAVRGVDSAARPPPGASVAAAGADHSLCVGRAVLLLDGFEDRIAVGDVAARSWTGRRGVLGAVRQLLRLSPCRRRRSHRSARGGARPAVSAPVRGARDLRNPAAHSSSSRVDVPTGRGGTRAELQPPSASSTTPDSRDRCDGRRERSESPIAPPQPIELARG
jgi:hypothetical protein